MTLTTGLSVNKFVHTTLKFLSRQLNICHSSIALVEENNLGFRLYDANHDDETGLEAGDFIRFDMTILSEIVEHREPRYRPDIASCDSGYAIDKRLLSAGIQSDFLIPLWIENRCLGTLNVAAATLDGFCEDRRRFLLLLASSLAQSLQNIHLIKSLQESEQRYRSLIDDMHDMVQSVDSDGRFIYVNDAWLSLLGYHQQQLSELTLWDIIHPDSIQHCQNIFQRILLGENIYHIEAIFCTKDGTEIPVEGSISARRVGNQVVATQGIFRDIRKRKQAEKTIQTQIKYLNAIERISRISLRSSTMNSTLEQVLDAMLDIFQCDRAWLLYPCDPDAATWTVPMERTRPKWPGASAEGLEIVMTPDVANIFISGLKTLGPVRNDPQMAPVENNAFIRKKFSVASQMYMAIYPKTGKPWVLGIHHCAQAHIFSLEEQHIFNEIGLRVADSLSSLISFNNLKESQASLAEAQRIAHLGSWELNHHTQEIKWSDEVYQIFDTDAKSFTPTYQSFLNAIHPDDRDFVNKAFMYSIKTKAQYDITHRLKGKDGSIKHVHEYAETHYDNYDKPLRSVGTIQDVTSQVLAEKKLRLSAAVVESTAEGIIITDANNHIVSTNKAFTIITGYGECEMLGKIPRILRSTRHNQKFYSKILRSIQKTGLWQGEVWLQHKTGKIFPTWSTISAVVDDVKTVSNYVSVFSDISSIKHSQERLDYLAYHDPLTSLPNRLLLNDRIDHALQHAHRENGKIALFFIDLDRFKNVNDSLGHPVGDQLLKKVASRIKSMIREGDTLARLGGDEFVILLEDISSTKDLAILAKKVIEIFVDPFFIIGHELQLTISLGISLYPRDGLDSATLIKNADAAMYRAKEVGRNNYQFYTSALTSVVFERLILESALRQALKNNELILHYQPQYSLTTKKLIGAETLIRWQHPQMGLVYPEKFIPLAEETGLIYSIGEWVLQSACAQMQQWLRDGLPIETIAVNVSAYQCQRREFIDTVKTALQLSQLAPKHLELEITESILMQQIEKGADILDELKRLGIRIGIDDFGTGYSSLSYLRQLPIHKLKIDKSFINDITQDGNDAAITCAVIALGHSLQLTVLAEGVETQNQLDFLIRQGCHEAQGYLYSIPVPCDKFRQLISV